MRITKLMALQHTPESLIAWHKSLPQTPFNPYFTNEERFQRAVEKWMEGFGWKTYHTHTSLHSNEGFPDLAAVHPRCGCEVMAELKSASKRAVLTEAQASWVLAYALDPERFVFLWDPRHEDAITGFLQHHNDRFVREKHAIK